jgi:hypothetical protein
MPIHVDAYMAGGIARGVLARAGSLREVLEHDRALTLERVQWQPLGGRSGPSSGVSIPIDDVLVAVGDDDAGTPMHASWHAIRVEIGPYLIDGEMPTFPGFDPGRALTRPTGDFVLLRDVRIAPRDAPDPHAAAVPAGKQALVNRYGVESVACDLMLGFFFPGAELIHADVAEAGAS